MGKTRPVAKIVVPPTVEELFCVVCALRAETGETKPFCSKECEDLWNAYDFGKISWAVFYELVVS